MWLINQSVTYINDEEVQPAPVVGEVLLKAVGEPLEHHLQDEDVGEDLVGVLQHHFDHPPLLDVDVLKSLNGGGELRFDSLQQFLISDFSGSLEPCSPGSPTSTAYIVCLYYIITNSCADDQWNVFYVYMKIIV